MQRRLPATQTTVELERAGQAVEGRGDDVQPHRQLCLCEAQIGWRLSATGGQLQQPCRPTDRE